MPNNFLQMAILLLLTIIAHSTTVTFYVDHYIEQPMDYVQIQAIVKTQGESLQVTIQKASDIIKKINATVRQYCHSYAKTKSQCKKTIEIGSYSIKPKYDLYKKKPIFAGFMVAHQMRISVKDSRRFGKLIDDVLKIGVNKINSLKWRPFQESESEEKAVVEGAKQAQTICQKIGMHLYKIVSVDQISDFAQMENQIEEGQDKRQKRNQKEIEEEYKKETDISDAIVYYKFVVECQPPNTAV